MKLRLVLIFTLYIIATLAVHAQNRVEDGQPVPISGYSEPDSLQISLLTCSPGPEVYALYGHTAIRVQNSKSKTDVVFNYGSFNMSEPNFILKFMLGLLDYELGLSSFERFYLHYTNDGCDITQQILNLTPEEKARMLDVLMTNYQPQNRGYRYNFLYDNCSTRPRDIISSVVDGELVWDDKEESKSYRMLMHECNDPWPWSKLGVDLVLGQSADRMITPREEEFLPVYLLNHLDDAQIHDSKGTVRPAVANKVVLQASRPMDMSKEFPLTPSECVVILLLGASILAFIEKKKHRLFWGVDVVLFFAQGVAGVLIFILFFFSEHPTVDSNWLLWCFNPIPLLYLPVMCYLRAKNKKEPFMIVNTVWLLLFGVIACVVVPQDFPSESVCAAVVLVVRSMSHVRHDYLSKM